MELTAWWASEGLCWPWHLSTKMSHGLSRQFSRCTCLEDENITRCGQAFSYLNSSITMIDMEGFSFAGQAYPFGTGTEFLKEVEETLRATTHHACYSPPFSKSLEPLL